MPKGWRRVRLADILALDIEQVQVEPQAEYSLAGVYSFGRGLFEREPLPGAKTRYRTLNRLRSRQLVISKLKAWEGALAVVPESFDGFVVSPEFPTFAARNDVDPAFLGVYCAQPSFWRELQYQARGMGGRRERVHPRQFLDVQILLPSIADQRRIVDLLTNVTQCLEAVTTQKIAVERSLVAIREAKLQEVAAETVALGDILLGIESGRSPAGENRLPRQGERAVLKVSAVDFGQFNPDEVKTVSGDTRLPENSRVKVGDVLITRANTRERVGAACQVLDVPDNYFLCDKTLRIVPDSAKITPEFLVEVLQLQQARKQIELAATGTSSSMKNISQMSIRSLQIPLPALEDQTALCGLLNELRAVGSELDAEASALRHTHRLLLDSLLTGAHVIPESYDRALEVAG